MSFLQSLKLAALTTAICIVVGYPFGYLMARLSPVARSVVMLLIIKAVLTNALIRIYGWRILLMGNGPINTVQIGPGAAQTALYDPAHTLHDPAHLHHGG